MALKCVELKNKLMIVLLFFFSTQAMGNNLINEIEGVRYHSRFPDVDISSIANKYIESGASKNSIESYLKNQQFKVVTFLSKKKIRKNLWRLTI